MHTRFLVSAVLAAVSLSAQTPPKLPDWVSIDSDIQYSRFPETRLDVMQPKTPVKGKRPGVILIHGGGWINMQKEQIAATAGLPWLEKGFVVANVEYRLAKAALAPAAVTDVLIAAKWFHDHAKKYNVDTRRIVVTGPSAGGHLALMVGMTPKAAKLGPQAKVAAVVNFYGITDVADQLEGPNMRKYAVTWLPESVPNRRELAKRLSPMTWVRKDLPPILTLHGDADPTVPYQQGVKLTEAVRAAGGHAELLTVPGGKHGFPKEKLVELYPHIFEFLKAHGVM